MCLQHRPWALYFVSPCFPCSVFHVRCTWNILCLLPCKRSPGLHALKQDCSCSLVSAVADLGHHPPPPCVCRSSGGLGLGWAGQPCSRGRFSLRWDLQDSQGMSLLVPVEAQKSRQKHAAFWALPPASATVSGLVVPPLPGGAMKPWQRAWVGTVEEGGSPLLCPDAPLAQSPGEFHAWNLRARGVPATSGPPRLAGGRRLGIWAPDSGGLLRRGLWPARAVCGWGRAHSSHLTSSLWAQKLSSHSRGGQSQPLSPSASPLFRPQLGGGGRVRAVACK